MQQSKRNKQRAELQSAIQKVEPPANLQIHGHDHKGIGYHGISSVAVSLPGSGGHHLYQIGGRSNIEATATSILSGMLANSNAARTSDEMVTRSVELAFDLYDEINRQAKERAETKD